MGWLAHVWETLQQLWQELNHASPQVIGATWLVGFVSAFVLLLLLGAFRLYLASRKIDNPQNLKIKVVDDEGTVRLNSGTINRLNLSRARGQRVIITSLKPAGNGHRRLATVIENLSWRSDQNLANDTLEISERSLGKLFKGQDVEDGNSLPFDLKLYELKGFADYWNNPDPRAKFANRFAVYLTSIVLIIEYFMSKLS